MKSTAKSLSSSLKVLLLFQKKPYSFYSRQHQPDPNPHVNRRNSFRCVIGFQSAAASPHYHLNFIENILFNPWSKV